MRGTLDLLHDAGFTDGIIPAHAGNTHSTAYPDNPWRDHPRACGEHNGEDQARILRTGSSPRMRGTLRHSRPHHLHPGIIPAHAGNTNCSRSRKSRPWDHPRACGEHLAHWFLLVDDWGSSPRMRGTRHGRHWASLQLGIIPAHAGNTAPVRGREAVAMDHPRACGEHHASHAHTRPTVGSSPRMRGTLHVVPIAEDRHGIIPAHAGNTNFDENTTNTRRDHPRACGEHRSFHSRHQPNMGSSPRMRGTHVLTIWDWASKGIIPAHAGNTDFDVYNILLDRDHPRACGEHTSSIKVAYQDEGSSPRMRGTRRRNVIVIGLLGIIPAHAGNTPRLHLPAAPNGDHPRACGEHPSIWNCGIKHAGSSPRMRGTLYGKGAENSGRGIIPAHAGNTLNRDRRLEIPGDHPRACGEHALPLLGWSGRSGSSPRMRGTLVLQLDGLDATGIIPAHAGNTFQCGRDARHAGDHPRACGEHFGKLYSAEMAEGSSPRMRGTLMSMKCLHILKRDHPRACGEHQE